MRDLVSTAKFRANLEVNILRLYKIKEVYSWSDIISLKKSIRDNQIKELAVFKELRDNISYVKPTYFVESPYPSY
ncbi:hypothetical protein V6M85_06535 [Sulfolobus tengchongensis]|uniref:Uncharacterized protein n=1 Tax=Sulfolobus tengchongensis TaxID=207809 RepID=A0AAX4L617_9CREN